MKKIKHLLILAPLLGLLACNNDGNNEILRWGGENDISDCHIYVGSPTGAIEVAQATDSIKELNINKYISTIYRKARYTSLTVEFVGDMATVTYPDSLGRSVKVLSTYQFKGDSLFINTSNGDIFMARGNDNEMFREDGIFFKKQEVTESGVTLFKDTSYINKEVIDLDKAVKLAGYSSASAMTNDKDTIMWVNVKYIFKK